jgi:prepilin-type N-terminal cleavage/methylation domain-containing protein
VARKAKRRGFTLIEVLVVMAIIGLLAAIVFPVLSRARTAGRKPDCLSNLRQLASASMMYASDADEHLFGPENAAGRTVYWGDILQPYLKSTAILHCPTEGLHLQFEDGILQPWSYQYALNDVLDDFDDPIGAAWAALSQAEEPARLILFVDGWPLEGDPGPGNGRNRHVVNWVYGERDRLRHEVDDGNPRHLGNFLMVTLDGHVTNRPRGRAADGTFRGGTLDIEWLLQPGE